jgi:hypothetical protein
MNGKTEAHQIRNDKWIQMLRDLIDKTRQGDIQWNPVDLPSPVAGEQQQAQVVSSYACDLQEIRLSIQQLAVKAALTSTGSYWGFYNPVAEGEAVVELAIMDGDHVSAVFPRLGGINELYQAVKDQIADRAFNKLAGVLKQQPPTSP